MKPEPGDVILYPVSGRSALSSKIVAIGEMLFGVGGKTQYSHAAVYAMKGHEWEARWPSVGVHPIDTGRDYEIRRFPGYTQAQRGQVLKWFYVHEGDLYDLVALVTFGLVELPHAEVCSEAVDRALRSAGIKPNREGKRLLSPDALADFASILVERYTAP